MADLLDDAHEMLRGDVAVHRRRCLHQTPEREGQLRCWQISMTLDTYSHVVPSIQLDAARRFDDVLKAAPRSEQ